MSNKCCSGKNLTLIFPCSGASDIGELSDRVARRMMKTGVGKMYCLAGIGGHIEDIINNTKESDEIIVIDGCSTLCALKTLVHAGLKGKSLNLEELGFIKGQCTIKDDIISKAFAKINEKLNMIKKEI
jgi:uncharacterized metal-binding protein